MKLPIGRQTYPYASEIRWRHRFSVLAVLAAVTLIGWGGFVTSINAGLAVPDWPTSFGSLDPFETGFHVPGRPELDWWERVPILAEHGHRLLGMLMGLLTVILAAWTWKADERRWMRWLGLAALVLVIVQGVLGGLRVVLTSVDLAVVHACVAQLFFSLLVAMTLFTSRGWLEAEGRPPAAPPLKRLRMLAVGTAAAIYVQIFLGVLLRHPGMGIDPALAGLHILGACAAAALIVWTFVTVHRHYRSFRLLRRTAHALLGLLGLQVALGFTAYFVLLDEAGMLQPSRFQVVVNTSHLLVGTWLLATAVCLALLALCPERKRAPRPEGGSTPRGGSTPGVRPTPAAGRVTRNAPEATLSSAAR